MFDLNIYSIFSAIQKNPEMMNVLMDEMNSKYNNTFWKQVSDVMPLSQSKRFATLIKESQIAVKASLLSAFGKKPLRSFEGFEERWMSMHKAGHGFKIEQADINTLKELNLVDAPTGAMLMDMYMDRGSAIIQGFHSLWNGWIYNALSKYEIQLMNQDKEEGVVDMMVPKANKLIAKDAGNKGWFDGSFAGSKIDDLQRMDEQADAVGMPADRVFMVSKSLANKMRADKELREAILATAGYLNITEAVVSRRRFLDLLSQTLDIAPFVVIDEKSRIEKNGVPMDAAKDFDENKIVLVPASKLFDMHPSVPDYADDSNPNTIKGFTEGGIIGSLTQYESEPFAMITNTEAWMFPVFKNPKYLVGLDTSKGSSTGVTA